MNKVFSPDFWLNDVGQRFHYISEDYTGAGNAPILDQGMHPSDMFDYTPVDLSLSWLFEAESHCCVVESKRRDS